jgi:hypothetical protein
MREQVRTLKKGVQRRYVVDFQIEDLIVDTRPGPLNDEFANVIREIVVQQWKAIRKPVAPATLERRERAKRDGKSRSYKKRYDGGRIGPTPPTPSIRYALDSGRTVDNLFLRPRRRSSGESVVTVNTPANRFKEDLFGNDAAFQGYLAELRSQIPLLRGQVDAATSREIRGALEELKKGLASANEARYRQLLAKRRAAIIKLFRTGAGAFL